jgi:hypothetical protein
VRPSGYQLLQSQSVTPLFASIMSSRGVALEEIADAMRHIDTRMTSLVYRHRLNPVVTSTAGVMEAIFGGTLAPFVAPRGRKSLET